jgi:hypothetical protein
VVFTEIQATLELRAAMSWSSIVTIDSQPDENAQGRFESHQGPERGGRLRRSAHLNERQDREQ